MSAWKSPLLYLGMLIIAVAAAALAAPHFIDWDGYRDRFEAYGRDFTGRQVQIAGEIDARLFPWPVLKLGDVRIANPEGARTPNLFEAGEIVLRMQLAPLLSGHVEVESIEIDRPVFGFERLASEEWSWGLAPERRHTGFLDPEAVSVEQVTLTNGAIILADGRRGGQARLDGVEATLSAPSLSGPWRVRGGASYQGEAIDLAVSTGKIRPGEATTVTVNIDPKEAGGFSYTFDGEIGGQGDKPVKGRLRAVPARPVASGERPAERGAAFTLRTELTADFETVELDKIEIAPDRSADPGKFLTGQATVRLGERIGVSARLDAARLDLDTLFNGVTDLAPDGAALEGVAALLDRLPDGFSLELALGVTSLVVEGQSLDDARLRAEASAGRLRVEEFSVSLPGQSRFSFNGLFLAEQGAPQLSGEVSVDSVSVRDLAEWALPAHRQSIAEVWSGVRGRLKLASKIDATPLDIRLSEIVATLDDASLSGGFSYRAGADSELAIRLVADRLNLDRYAPEGLLSRAGRERRMEIGFDLVAACMGFANFQLTVQADRVMLHRVEAQDIAVDIGANDDGIELRTVEIGNVEGARMDIAGLVRFPGEGVSGSINALIDADDPRGLMRLFGLLDGVPEDTPKWVSAIGRVDVKLVAEAISLNRYTQASSSLTGRIGDSELSVDARYDGEMAGWRDGHMKVEGTAQSSESHLLTALTGLHATEGKRQSSFKLSASGSVDRGISASIESEILGAKLQFAGTGSERAGRPEIKGRGAVLAERSQDFLAALDLPVGELSPLAGVLSAETEIAYDGRVLALSGLSGTAGGSSYSGDLRLAFEPIHMATGKLSIGRISLPWLLQAALLPPDAGAGLETRFKTRLPDFTAVDLEVEANRIEASDRLSITDAAVTLQLDAQGLSIEAKGTGPDDAPATFAVSAKLDSGGATVNGTVETRLALQDVFRAEDGEAVMDATGDFRLSFTGSGRTPSGLLASAEANGEYDLPSGTLRRVDPRAFGRDLATVSKPAEIDGLIAGSLRSGNVAFTGGKGTLRLLNGVLTASPLGIAGEGMTGEIKAVFEPASGTADLELVLSLLDPPGLPAFALAYAGPPSAMQPSSDTQELKSRLAVRVLQEGIDQLEEIQRQEQELIREEEEFRQEQQQREREREEARRRQELDAPAPQAEEGDARQDAPVESAPSQEAPVESAPVAPIASPPVSEQGASRETDEPPAPAREAAQPPESQAQPSMTRPPESDVKAEVPKPRRKPPPTRVELRPEPPAAPAQSLAPAPVPAPAPTQSQAPRTTGPIQLFPINPQPRTDFPSRTSVRDR